MRLKTVLNRVHKVKGFVYEKARFHGDEIEVAVRPQRRSRPIGAGCGRRGPGYDTLPARRFAFVPLWALSVFLIYARRRVDCPRCPPRRMTAELRPWADGKNHLTHAYAVCLARGGRRLSAAADGVTWPRSCGPVGRTCSARWPGSSNTAGRTGI